MSLKEIQEEIRQETCKVLIQRGRRENRRETFPEGNHTDQPQKLDELVSISSLWLFVFIYVEDL